VEVIHLVTTAGYTAAWLCLASIGPFRYVGRVTLMHVHLSDAAFRWAVVQTSAAAILFAERALEIVSTPCFVARVLLHRNAGSSSWRREVSSKGYRFLRGHIGNLSLSYCVPLIVRYQHLCRSQQSLVRGVLVGVFRAYHGQSGSIGISKRPKVLTTCGILRYCNRLQDEHVVTILLE
jgi:hypothetical protein